MNTTAKGTEFEDRVYNYLNSLLEKDELNFAPKNIPKSSNTKNTVLTLVAR